MKKEGILFSQSKNRHKNISVSNRHESKGLKNTVCVLKKWCIQVLFSSPCKSRVSTSFSVKVFRGLQRPLKSLQGSAAWWKVKEK